MAVTVLSFGVLSGCNRGGSSRRENQMVEKVRASTVAERIVMWWMLMVSRRVPALLSFWVFLLRLDGVVPRCCLRHEPELRSTSAQSHSGERITRHCAYLC